MESLTELLLIFAARAQHIHEVIMPALNRGAIVVCDRFIDATYAYQAGGRNLPVNIIEQLDALVLNSMKPDYTILFDVSVETGMKRAKSRAKLDRFENERLSFFERVRSMYLKRYSLNKNQTFLIDANQDLDSVRLKLDLILKEILNK